MLSRDEPILVAGAGGFIGGHLIGFLRASGFSRIRAADCKPPADWWQRHPGVEELRLDLRSPAAAADAVAGCRYVVNLAADMGGMGFISQHRARCMLSVLISTSLLQASCAVGVERYFYASSACVYPVGLQTSAALTPLAEDAAYPALPEPGYGEEKLFSEQLCRSFTADYGLATRIARYHNVYGSHGAWTGGREKAPAALCRKVAEAILGGADEIEIWGDGNQTRSFMHVDDCVRGTLMIMEGDLAGPVNLGSSELVSVNQLADLVEQIAGARFKRRYNLAAPAGVRGRNSDNTLLRSAFGWEPSVPLRDGLARTYGWVYDQAVAAR